MALERSNLSWTAADGRRMPFYGVRCSFTTLALHALTYVIRLHADLTSEHGAPTLGTQNQAVDFILADPELSRAVATWAAMPNIGEASTKPYQRLPHDELYRRVREYLEKISSRPD